MNSRMAAHRARRSALSLSLIAFVSMAQAQQPDVVTRGREQFTQKCAPCHGAEKGDFGRAMLPGTDALRIKYQGKVPALLEQRTDLTPALLRTYVRKGTWSMPPFRKTELSDAQIDEISAYLSSAARSAR